MKKNNYFGNYKKSNQKKIINYMNLLEKSIAPYLDYTQPFTNGDYNLNYGEYLKDKHLNRKLMTPKEVYEYLSYLYQNIPNWSNPGTMINVIPPVNLVAQAAINVTSNFNANFAQDTYAGYLIASELEVSKYMSELLEWDPKKSHGIFTFGGKGTNLYATKIALMKANPNTKYIGCVKEKYFMITSSNGHPCHLEVCDWLGIGMNQCIEVPCLDNGIIDVDKVKEIVCSHLNKGEVLIGYNLNGGSTNELVIDPIKKIYNLNQEIIKEYNLNYAPHIHVDFVLGWIGLLFKDFDFKNKPYLNGLKQLYESATNVTYADSVGIDFHKTGFCPYISSLFLLKNKKDFYLLNPESNDDIYNMSYGEYNPYHTTLELTRSSTGPIAALTTLKSLGVEGFQQIFADLFESASYIRKILEKNEDIILVNKETQGITTFFIVKPYKYKKLTIEEILALPKKDIERIKEFNVNYGKFLLNKCINKEIDFIFTSSRSYQYPGTNIKLGALKLYPMSVFLDKKKSKKIVEKIFKTIEEFQKDENKIKRDTYISDDMVYKERKWK